jgi:hypothetical protein
MTVNPNAPHFILAAVKRIYGELPHLVGREAWNSIYTQVDLYIVQLETQSNHYLASTELLGLLARYKPAHQRLSGEMKVQEIITVNIRTTMEKIAKELGIDVNSIDGLIAAAYAHFRWEFDPEIISLEGDVVTRSITERELDKAKSVKVQNIRLDLGDFTKISAGFITVAVGIITAPALPFVMPLLVVAAVLSTLSTLYDAMEIEIEEQEASVLFGMTQALGLMHGAGLRLPTLLKRTNEEREKCGLALLNERQMEHSLQKLEKLKVIKKTGDTYYVIENY